jgi:ElaB/YqjD/DUF883 family membrane-anchored ribosome-binding protein
MVGKKFASVPSDVDVETNAARADLDNQIAELRTEISRLTETVSAIGTGAKAVVTSEAEVLTERLRERVREEPVSTLLAIAGVAFVIGLLARR